MAADINRRLGVEVDPGHVVVMPGGKPTMFFSILMFADKGVEISKGISQEFADSRERTRAEREARVVVEDAEAPVDGFEPDWIDGEEREDDTPGEPAQPDPSAVVTEPEPSEEDERLGEAPVSDDRFAAADPVSNNRSYAAADKPLPVGKGRLVIFATDSNGNISKLQHLVLPQ